MWGSAQDDFMLGSELCSRKEHMHRMIDFKRFGCIVFPPSEGGKTIQPNLLKSPTMFRKYCVGVGEEGDFSLLR